MKRILNVFGMGLYIAGTIGVTAAAFNTLEGFYIACGILNLIGNIYGMVKTGKKFFNSED